MLQFACTYSSLWFQGFVCVLITAVFGHTVVFLALLDTNHFAAAAPSQTHSRSCTCLGFKYIMCTRENQPNLKKIILWKKLFKDALLELYVEFKREIEFRSKIFRPDISIASFLQISQVTQSIAVWRIFSWWFIPRKFRFSHCITESPRLENTSQIIESNLWPVITLSSRPWRSVPHPVFP